MNRLLLPFASALFVLVATLAAPAWADDAETCKKVGGDDSLAACTRLISSQTLRGGDLAQAYASRGVIYIRFKGDWDRAIADYGEALRLDPKNAGTRSTSVGSGLAAIQSAVGTMIAYATQPDNVALDGDGRNSPFTAALLKHIATPNVEIGTIMRRVRADVVAATLERQVPWDSSSLIGEVILAR
jgi:tetratricopeptide (TPR) repeat protein